MIAVILALLEAKELITPKEAEKLYDKFRYGVIPEQLKDAQTLIKQILDL